MKNKIFSVFKFILFLLILFLVISKVTYVLEHKTAREKYTDYYEHSDEYDVIFAGTSHMWNSVLPQELWCEYGITSFNWAYSNCSPAETYYVLNELLSKSKPKLVVMDLYGIIQYGKFDNGKWKEDTVEQQHVQFDTFPINKNKIAVVNDVFANYKDRLDFIFPSLLYHSRWNELGEADFKPNYSTEKGSNYLSGVGTGNYSKPGEWTQLVIDTACSPYVLKIIDLCKAKGIDLLFTYNPGVTRQSEVDCAYSIDEFFKSNGYEGVKYLNYLYIDDINPEIDFYLDNGHLNYSGALKFTSYLGDYINSNYQFDEHDENLVKAWNWDYEKYYEHKLQNIKDQTDLYTKLMLMFGNDLSVDIEVEEGSALLSDEKFNMLVAALGEDVSLGFGTDLTWNDKKCDVIITVTDNTNGEVLETWGRETP